MVVRRCCPSISKYLAIPSGIKDVGIVTIEPMKCVRELSVSQSSIRSFHNISHSLSLLYPMIPDEHAFVSFFCSFHSFCGVSPFFKLTQSLSWCVWELSYSNPLFPTSLSHTPVSASPAPPNQAYRHTERV